MIWLEKSSDGSLQLEPIVLKGMIFQNLSAFLEFVQI